MGITVRHDPRPSLLTGTGYQIGADEAYTTLAAEQQAYLREQQRLRDQREHEIAMQDRQFANQREMADIQQEHAKELNAPQMELGWADFAARAADNEFSRSLKLEELGMAKEAPFLNARFQQEAEDRKAVRERESAVQEFYDKLATELNAKDLMMPQAMRQKKQQAMEALSTLQQYRAQGMISEGEYADGVQQIVTADVGLQPFKIKPRQTRAELFNESVMLTPDGSAYMLQPDGFSYRREDTPQTKLNEMGMAFGQTLLTALMRDPNNPLSAALAAPVAAEAAQLFVKAWSDKLRGVEQPGAAGPKAGADRSKLVDDLGISGDDDDITTAQYGETGRAEAAAEQSRQMYGKATNPAGNQSVEAFAALVESGDENAEFIDDVLARLFAKMSESPLLPQGTSVELGSRFAELRNLIGTGQIDNYTGAYEAALEIDAWLGGMR